MPEQSTPCAGSDEWLAKLNRTISRQGQAEFEDSLFELVNEAVLVDHCAVFISRDDGSTAHLFTRSKLDEATCQRLAHAYTDSFHHQDPNLSPIAQKTQDKRLTLLPHRATATYGKDYKARFFTETGLIDKLSSLLRADDYSIYCSFYRLKGSGLFQDKESAELSRILPILTNLIFKHANFISGKANFISGKANFISGKNRLFKQKQQENQVGKITTKVPLGRTGNILDAENAAFARLTRREREVCVRILRGLTSEAISLDLAVAISTIHTYRKRAYARLGISSQNELFSLYLEFVPLYEDRQADI